MRIAIMADIHGNPIALDAVLGDIERHGGVDAYWVLGDIVALGPGPVEVLERLAALPAVRCVRGNTERYVCQGDRPPPSVEEARADPALLPVLLEIEGAFAWTQGAVTNGGWLEWLSGLPAELETTLPDGTRVLGLHVAPGREDGLGFRPGLDEAELADLLGACDADLLFVGHTHQSMDATAGGTRVVNVGSVSNPVPPDLRAEYAILEADPTGYRVERRRVDYDRGAVIAALERVRHPGAEFIIRHLRGLCEPYPGRPELHDRERTP
jgi:predicted phosphodiesterase